MEISLRKKRTNKSLRRKVARKSPEKLKSPVFWQLSLGLTFDKPLQDDLLVLVRVRLPDDGEEVTSRERAGGRHGGRHLRAQRQGPVLVVVHTGRRGRRDCRRIAQGTPSSEPTAQNENSARNDLERPRREECARTYRNRPRWLRDEPTRRRRGTTPSRSFLPLPVVPIWKKETGLFRAYSEWGVGCPAHTRDLHCV